MELNKPPEEDYIKFSICQGSTDFMAQPTQGGTYSCEFMTPDDTIIGGGWPVAAIGFDVFAIDRSRGTEFAKKAKAVSEETGYKARFSGSLLKWRKEILEEFGEDHFD